MKQHNQVHQFSLMLITKAKPDTIGTCVFVRYGAVSVTQGFTRAHVRDCARMYLAELVAYSMLS